MAKNLFWVISAADVEWITTAVSDPTFPVPLSKLLHATRFQHGKRYPLRGSRCHAPAAQVEAR